MKIKIVLLSFSFFLIAGIGFAQKKKEAKSIITAVAIKKYHNKEELERMQKGELLVLYVERIESLVKLLPYIAFATKPGVTMTTLGIPNDSDNRKSLDDQFEATDDFLKSTGEFQRRILPYSDTDNLISAILFYEETMKSLHEYSEFH
ncbi:hypothetical protein [Thalassobellus suaedae]|uniref:Uncharacterized protein n=1 Tax=Thalassobellus suaedae TaxID=3074124 RepID=A0ABY9Y2W7_9FLAO|nr:hypothetical protein RHP51_07355 [Flavobacteriaceae bacterium HL-DH14]WNH12442.1 hypothetical protein RHP49_16330 [Flavobacteriaceae bacterium HL-DH10]